MDVTIYHSDTKESQKLLDEAVAIAHADLIAYAIDCLPCSAEQKVLLVKAILKNKQCRHDRIPLSIQREA